jgi:hypothetical protein
MFKLVYMLIVASTGMPFGTIAIHTPMDHDTCVAFLQDEELADQLIGDIKEETGVDVQVQPVCRPIE